MLKQHKVLAHYQKIKIKYIAACSIVVPQESFPFLLSKPIKSFSQLKLVACFQLLSSALETGQMTSIAPQNLDEQSEIQTINSHLWALILESNWLRKNINTRDADKKQHHLLVLIELEAFSQPKLVMCREMNFGNRIIFSEHNLIHISCIKIIDKVDLYNLFAYPEAVLCKINWL